MVGQPRNPFGLDLETAMTVGVPQLQMPPQAPQTAPVAPKMGRGQIIAGILADALAGAMGRPGQFAARMGQQQDREAEAAQWGLRRRGELEDYEAKQQIEQRYAKPDVPPILRDANAAMAMSPEQWAAYRQLQGAKPQFIPDGWGGGQWVQPPAPNAAQPRRFDALPPNAVPIGGQTPPASGSFRRP